MPCLGRVQKKNKTMERINPSGEGELIRKLMTIIIRNVNINEGRVLINSGGEISINYFRPEVTLPFLISFLTQIRHIPPRIMWETYHI